MLRRGLTCKWYTTKALIMSFQSYFHKQCAVCNVFCVYIYIYIYIIHHDFTPTEQLKTSLNG